MHALRSIRIQTHNTNLRDKALDIIYVSTHTIKSLASKYSSFKNIHP